MAPPSNRRSGFSKRAQYTTFFAYLAGIVGVGLGIIALILSQTRPGLFDGLRGGAANAAAPVGRVVSAGRTGGANLLDTLGGFFMSGSRNAALVREAEITRVRLAEARDLAEENRRLKAMLDLPQGSDKPVAIARLIGSTPTSVRRFATLSVGANKGLKPGMPVRSALGLVGRVTSVSAASAQVMLITDAESMVPVRRNYDAIPAFAQGHGNGTLRLRLINLGINPLRPGDIFVTSGSGGLYRPGIAVAVVQYLTNDGAIARILSDPSASEFVMVDESFAASLGMPETGGASR